MSLNLNLKSFVGDLNLNIFQKVSTLNYYYGAWPPQGAPGFAAR